MVGGFAGTDGQLDGAEMDNGATEAAAIGTSGMLAGMIVVAGGRIDGWIGGGICTIDEIEGGGRCIIADDWMDGNEGGGIGIIVRTAGAAEFAVMVGKRLVRRLPDLGIS